MANVARECGVERKTVAGFLDVLEDLLLATRLEPFTRRARRALVAHPEVVLFRHRGLPLTSVPPDRSTVQQRSTAPHSRLVFQHLRTRSAWAGDGRRELAFWRTQAGREVDFVVYTPDEFVVFEVKNAGTVRERDLDGLRAFLDDYPEATAVLLYRGTERLRERGVWCIPVDSFLRAAPRPVSVCRGAGGFALTEWDQCPARHRCFGAISTEGRDAWHTTAVYKFCPRGIRSMR